jgi:solute carrier family 25 oxoglutarate transporter 11
MTPPPPSSVTAFTHCPFPSPSSNQTRDPTTGKLPYTGTFQTIGAVSKAGGVFSLWSGFLPYYGRCGGHTVAMFIAVDQLRTLYKKYQ